MVVGLLWGWLWGMVRCSGNATLLWAAGQGSKQGTGGVGGACGEGRVRGVRAFDATGAVSAEHGAAVDPTEGFNLPIGTTML